jgi:2-iminobutanoate/2-iminopropanoate deaminase
MKRVLVSSGDTAPSGLPFSPALRVGDWVFLSGQAGFDRDGKLGETIEEQTQATLENVQSLLRAAGCELDDVVTALVHLADLDTFDRYNAVYERSFADPRPTRTTVEAKLLPGLLVEITVSAVRPSSA